MNRLRAVFVCAVLFAAGLAASPVVVTSVWCTSNQGTVTNNSACAMAGVGASNPGGSSASISASYSASANALSLNTVGSASASETFNSPFAFYTSSANSNASWAADFTTGGTLRSGWVLVSSFTASAIANGPDSVASTVFSLGTSPLGGPAVSSTCTSLGHGSGDKNCGSVVGPQPIMLGTDIDFTGNIGATASSAVILGTANALAGVDVTFQFFESDDVTPVTVVPVSQSTVVPEPASWGLSIVGVMAAFLLRGRSRRLKSLQVLDHRLFIARV